MARTVVVGAAMTSRQFPLAALLAAATAVLTVRCAEMVAALYVASAPGAAPEGRAVLRGVLWAPGAVALGGAAVLLGLFPQWAIDLMRIAWR